MDIQNIILIFVALFSFVVTGYIYGRNKSSHINISFSLIYFFTGCWSLGIAVFSTTSSADNALLYVRLLNVAAILIASSFYYFSLSFPFLSKIIDKKNVFLIYLPSLIVVIIVFIPSVIIKDVKILEGGNEMLLSRGFILYSLVFMYYIVRSFLLLFKKYSDSEGINRTQLKYITIGFMFGFIFGTTFDMILPILNYYQLIWIGPLSAFIVMASVLYLIMRKN